MKRYDVRQKFQGAFTQIRPVTRYIVVHHAAQIYHHAAGLDTVAEVASFHTAPPPHGRGWPGIGYHIALAEDGPQREIVRYDVSDLNLQRAHVAMRNHELLGVSMLTNTDAQPGGVPEKKWLVALAEVLIELQRLYPQATIVGHKDVALPEYPTACPGDRWMQWKPQLLAIMAAMTAGSVLDNQRYRVIASGANLRSHPHVRPDTRLFFLPAEVGFKASAIVEGQRIANDSRWVYAAGLGYVHMSVIQPEPAA